MESTNQITDDAMVSTEYGLQIMHLENGRLKSNHPQVTLYHLKWARSALCNSWHSVWRSSCVIKHSTFSCALSAT